MINITQTSLERLRTNLGMMQASFPVKRRSEAIPEIHAAFRVTPNDLYEIYRRSYLETTGKCWNRESFIRRARGWTFYGTDRGYVAFRESIDNTRKITCAAGDVRDVIGGVRRLVREGLPLWGTISERLLPAAVRHGLIAIHAQENGASVVQTVLSAIPAGEFGGVKPVVTTDGLLVFDTDDVIGGVKCLIANEAFIEHATLGARHIQ